MAHRTPSIERVLCRVRLQHVPQVSSQQEKYLPYDKKRLCRPAIHHPWQAGVCPFLASVSSNVHPRISRSAKYLSCSPSISVWLRHCALWGALKSLSLDRILFFLLLPCLLLLLLCHEPLYTPLVQLVLPNDVHIGIAFVSTAHP